MPAAAAAVGVVLAAGLLVVAWRSLVHTSGRPAPVGSSPPVRRAPVAGFGEIGFALVPGGHPWCALLAETEAQRTRGLMGRHDLAGHDAMLFTFDRDTSGPFWMRDTPLALSIAWFRADGALVASTDMAPCADRPDCPLYPPAGPYRVALEVARGDLVRLGVTPDHRLQIGVRGC